MKNDSPASFPLPVHVVRATLLLFLLSFTGGFADDTWFNTNWKLRRVISNLSPTGGVLTTFPVPVRLTGDSFVSSSLVTGGGDITFVGEDGSQLFHEIEWFDAPGGNLLAWVCLPTFTNGTRFFAYTSNANPLSFTGSNASPDEALTLTGLATLRTNQIANRVWDSNFAMVFHFNEASGNIRDSSRYAHTNSGLQSNIGYFSNGILGPSYHFTTNVSGFVSNQLGVRIPSQHNNATNSLVSNFWRGSNFSMTMLMRYEFAPATYLSNVAGGNMVGLYWRGAGATTPGLVYRWGNTGPNGHFFGEGSTGLNSGALGGVWATTTVQPEVLAVNYPNSNTGTVRVGVYTNGIAARWTSGVASTLIPMRNNTGDLSFGAYQGTSVCTAPSFWDELRLSAVLRSSNWLATEDASFRNATPGGFFSLGTNECFSLFFTTNTVVLAASPASGLSTNGPFSLSLTASPTNGFWSTNAGATWNLVAQGGSTIVLSNSVTVLATGVNPFGVSNANTNSFTYTVDVTAPVVFSVSPASGLVTNAPFTLALSNGSGWGSAVWSTNQGANWVPLALAGTNLVVSNTNVLWLHGTNWAGAANSSTNFSSFSVDLTNRVVLSVSPADGTVSTSAIGVALFNATGSGTVVWSTNEGTVWTLLGPAGTNLTLAVSTNLLVVTTNWAGVPAGTTNRWSFVVDPAADVSVPLVGWTGPADGFVTNAAFSVSLAVSKSNGWYSFDGSTWTRFGPGAVSVPFTATSTLRFHARNTYGLSTATNARTYTIDQRAPVITGLQPSTVTNRAFTLSLQVDEPTGYWSTNNGVTVASFASNTNLTFASDLFLMAWAVDAAGNSTATNLVAYRIVVDATKDDVSALGGLRNGAVLRAKDVTISYQAKESPLVEIYSLEGRLVRSLRAAIGEIDTSRRTIRWDGLDLRGRRSPPGVYLLALKVGGKVVDQRKFVLTME